MSDELDQARNATLRQIEDTCEQIEDTCDTLELNQQMILQCLLRIEGLLRQLVQNDKRGD